MDGSNSIKLNPATVKLAIEYYLNKVVLSNEVKVTDVSAKQAYTPTAGTELEVTFENAEVDEVPS